MSVGQRWAVGVVACVSAGLASVASAMPLIEVFNPSSANQNNSGTEVTATSDTNGSDSVGRPLDEQITLPFFALDQAESGDVTAAAAYNFRDDQLTITFSFTRGPGDNPNASLRGSFDFVAVRDIRYEATGGHGIGSGIGFHNILYRVSMGSGGNGLFETVLESDNVGTGTVFTLGELGGNVRNSVSGSTVGELEAGRVYRLFYDVSLSAAGAAADGPGASSGSIALNFSQLGLIGDYNDNGQVEQGDLNLVLNNWGTATTPAEWVNFRGLDGGTIGSLVDQAELNLVLNNWGSSIAPSFVGSAIPEPASMGLAGLGLILASRRVRFRSL
ncbi:MAG: PEP-CTERM sorting domain-containing protein [Planctomycetota bacterium]